MTAPTTPAGSLTSDQSDRVRVNRQTGTTMFVEAGAGTGKTSSLVGRVLELVSGPSAVPISSIAAITFTDKAAAELRNRIRAELNDRLGTPEGQRQKATLQEALAGLDSAAISTLHGFARRILAEHPIEAGLPPLFETFDQIASDVEFDERWHRFVDDLLSDPDAQWAVSLLDAAGVQPAELRTIAASFNSNWDRVRSVAEPPACTPVVVDELLARGHALSARRRECHEPDDPLLARFEQLDAFLERLSAALSDVERFLALRDVDDSRLGVPKVRRTGRRPNWADVASVRASFDELREGCLAAALAAVDGAISMLCSRVAAFTLESAEQRRAAGRLEFHDLLVRARELLRSSPEARASLHQRYRFLLLDEFQDTDPIQIEIAVLIATAHEGSLPSAESVATSSIESVGGKTAPVRAPRWDQLDTTPGQLFFVGDPKQSIYRFRRADIALFGEARRRFGHDIGESASLKVNFRSTAPIIDWINAVFGSLMASDPDDAGDRVQAPYTNLEADRSDVGGGPAVTVLGLDAHDKKQTGINAEGIRTVEAADIAGVITEVMHNGWHVHDRHAEAIRPARLSDIAILVPTRTCLPQLETGLSAASVPYRLEASEFVWRSRTVRDLMMCLRAAADPDDALAVVSALRTPMYGCGDDDLYLYYRSIGSWSYFVSDVRALPESELDRVASALRHLRSLYDEHTLVSPSVLLERLVRERRVFEQAAAGPRTREVWRHVRYLIDQARAWSESQHGGLRKFLRWVEMQGAERAKVTEAILPESDDDSVRVMTVHASKGLQFPIVIVAGLQGNGASGNGAQAAFADASLPDGVDTWYGGALAVRLRKAAQTSTYEAWSDAERSAEHHERIRLLYVACTRARDHLVVSLHRAAPSAKGDERNRSHAQVLCDVLPPPDHAHLAAVRWDYRSDIDASGADAELSQDDTAPLRTALPDRPGWLRRRDGAAARSRRRSALSATGVAHHTDTRGSGGMLAPQPTQPPSPQMRGKAAPDDHLGGGRAPARRGRGATATGKAVHGVLQAIDLSSGEGLGTLAAAQASAEGIAGRQGDIEAYVRSALTSDEVKRATAGRHWREVYTAAPLDGLDTGAVAPAVVEGFIDLLYEDTASGELVVVDHKTDALGAMPEVDSERAQQYRRQGAVYAWCIEQATDRSVSRVVLLYLLPDGLPARADVLDGDALRRAVGEVAVLAGELAGAPR